MYSSGFGNKGELEFAIKSYGSAFDSSVKLDISAQFVRYVITFDIFFVN